ncbi:glycosyltransferase, partial [Acinetobacter sp. RIT592]
KKKRKYRIFRDCHMSWVASQNRFKNIYYKMFKLFFARIINNTEKYCKVYALGEEEYEYLRTIGVRDDKIEYLYHGYNEDVMYFNEDERKYIRDKYSINKDDIVISYIGKFDESKRPDIIFDIVNKLDQEYVDNKNIKLLFIGPKNQIYMDIFNKKRIESKITIEIIVDESKPFAELRKYFSASDICIFPKACTLSSIHAQVCGCKVIMENHKSNRERVIESENLYEIDNIIKASEILKKCIEDINAKQERIYVKGLEEREYKNQVCLLRKCIKEKEQI